MSYKPTFQDLADLALLSQADIMRESGLSANTVRTIFNGEPVKKLTLLKALAVINKELGASYTLEMVEAPYSN